MGSDYGWSNSRNLGKSQLGGVIFGTKKTTINECLSKQLFERTLFGIFKAASSGQMNTDPYAWNTDGSQRTPYPAQVQIRVKLQCKPLTENQFKPIISDNYYAQNLFWRLNNNSLSGMVPESLSQVEGLILVYVTSPVPIANLYKNNHRKPFTLWAKFYQSLPSDKTQHLAIALGTSLSGIFVITLIVALLIWWRYRKNQQIFFDVNGMLSPLRIIREIKQLKTLRDQLAANMGSQDEAQQAMLEKYQNRGTYEDFKEGIGSLEK
ncbi:hypothetical protein L2E82_25304 [Cichorium intybus]|uniref:Uncharacterized protein n=1 Tax=Cichorium intybus TaxID=13427 RepID=A0ACB9E378_CICIN|nr:hypothetical protein L2E82_25304 [Cichorium intybus]